MHIEVVSGPIEAQTAQVIAVGLFEDTELPVKGAIGELDAVLRQAISTVLSDGDFRAKKNETLLLYAYGLVPARRVILVGMGKRTHYGKEAARQAAAAVAVKAQDLHLTDLCIAAFDAESDTVPLADTVEAVTEGALLGTYQFTELKTERDAVKPSLERLAIVAPPTADAKRLAQSIRAGSVIAESTLLARDLVNRPANIASPAHIAGVAREFAASAGLDFRVLDKAAMETLGMELLLSVNQGGGEPAQMAIVEHNAQHTTLPTVVLVGKGITFDTGGISLKPSEGMEKMKGDMGGAAAVLGAIRAAALLDLPMHVVALAPLTENMPDARATKPGDVKRSLKGLTVEIINTDAEGRLVLADALTYAGEFSPDAVLDIATLTGARVIALGDHAAAVMGDEALIGRLKRAGEITGERVWQLPLFEEYGEQLKSDVADLKNVGGRPAGTITAGFFLSKFVPEDTPWVHIDIAGLGMIDKARSYVPAGGTGFGVRLLLEFLRGWCAEAQE